MDKETWQKFQKGDHSAFHEIYTQHIDLLYGYGMKLIRDKELVEEYIQAMFIYLWEHRSSIAYPNNTTSYLVAILRNRIAKERKKRSVLNIIYADFQDMECKITLVPDEDKSLEKEEIDVGQLMALDEGMRLLTPHERELLYLKYYKNMSNDEITEIMGITNPTVRNLAYTSIKKLRGNMALAKTFLVTIGYIFK